MSKKNEKQLIYAGVQYQGALKIYMGLLNRYNEGLLEIGVRESIAIGERDRVFSNIPHLIDAHYYAEGIADKLVNLAMELSRKHNRTPIAIDKSSLLSYQTLLHDHKQFNPAELAKELAKKLFNDSGDKLRMKASMELLSKHWREDSRSFHINNIIFTRLDDNLCSLNKISTFNFFNLMMALATFLEANQLESETNDIDAIIESIDTLNSALINETKSEINNFQSTLLTMECTEDTLIINVNESLFKMLQPHLK